VHVHFDKPNVSTRSTVSQTSTQSWCIYTCLYVCRYLATVLNIASVHGMVI